MASVRYNIPIGIKIKIKQLHGFNLLKKSACGVKVIDCIEILPARKRKRELTVMFDNVLCS